MAILELLPKGIYRIATSNVDGIAEIISGPLKGECLIVPEDFEMPVSGSVLVNEDFERVNEEGRMEVPVSRNWHIAKSVRETYMTTAINIENANTDMVQFEYVNHRGEKSKRRIVVMAVQWKATPYHPTAQWLLYGYDMDKHAYRSFAMKDITNCERLREQL